MATIQSDILRGCHPVTIMRRHELTVAQLQNYVIALAVIVGSEGLLTRGRAVPRRLPPVREAHWRTWEARFRKLQHFGV